MKRTRIILLIAAVYVLAVVAFRLVVVKRETPPLEREFDEIAAWTYAYYDRHGSLPADPGYLPDRLERLVGGSGITWDAERQTYQYNYGTEYPVDVPLWEIATFGLIRADRPKMAGLITPDMVRTNTPIYRSAGKLPSLP